MKINLPKLIGHRGVKDLAPENTIYSIESAIRYQFKWIEVDVKITKDNVPFLLHDNLLDRTTSGKGLPYEYSYNEIVRLDAGSWFNKKFHNAYTPTLEEVLNICGKHAIGLNIELKPNEGKEKENVNAVSSLISKKIVNCQYFFSSFNYYSLKLIRKKMHTASLCYLIDYFKNEKNLSLILDDCLDLKCFSIGFNLNSINQQIVNICKENNLLITVYSEKNINYTQAISLWNLGVDSIFVDNPLSYKKILNSSID